VASELIPKVELISVDLIDVINPRERNRRLFKEIVQNIRHVGLKKPITVARRSRSTGVRYDLICGQGRFEAYQQLGQRKIPALIRDANTEDCLVMSLVENIARRNLRATELLRDIEGLKGRGYADAEIAEKTGLSVDFVKGVNRLLEQGELRLLHAVEAGNIPLTIAVEIAEANDADVQQALQRAYETKLLRGRKLVAARRLIQLRRVHGKGVRPSGTAKRDRNLSADALLRIYRQDVERKSLLIRKAQAARDQLLFVTEALRTLLADDHFVTLLRAESLETLPRNLAERIRSAGHT